MNEEEAPSHFWGVVKWDDESSDDEAGRGAAAAACPAAPHSTPIITSVGSSEWEAAAFTSTSSYFFGKQQHKVHPAKAVKAPPPQPPPKRIMPIKPPRRSNVSRRKRAAPTREFTKGVVHMNPTDGSLVFTPDDMDKEEEVRGATPRAESEKSVRLRTLQIRDCVDPDTSSSHGPPTRKRRFGLALRAGDPESEFFRDWDIFTTFLLMFTALVTPFEVAFLDTDLRDDASTARALANRLLYQ
jgi:hypothetical protein